LNRAANFTILTVYDPRPPLLLWLYQLSIVHNAVARRGTVIVVTPAIPEPALTGAVFLTKKKPRPSGYPLTQQPIPSRGSTKPRRAIKPSKIRDAEFVPTVDGVNRILTGQIPCERPD
jgi:hypothetical protein